MAEGKIPPDIGKMSFEDALEELQRIVGQLEKGEGKLDQAISTYRTFAETLPGHPRAPEALWRVARLLESDGDIESAAQAFMDVHVHFPSSDYGSTSLFRSGLQSYRLDELADAAVAWDTLIQSYPDSSYRPAARLLRQPPGLGDQLEGLRLDRVVALVDQEPDLLPGGCSVSVHSALPTRCPSSPCGSWGRWPSPMRSPFGSRATARSRSACAAAWPCNPRCHRH